MKQISQFLFYSLLMLGFSGNAYELPASLTPPESPSPRINGPGVFGVRPGSAFLYTIPAAPDQQFFCCPGEMMIGTLFDEVVGKNE